MLNASRALVFACMLTVTLTTFNTVKMSKLDTPRATQDTGRGVNGPVSQSLTQATGEWSTIFHVY